MAADANRLAAALAYEDERKRRLAETIPTLTGPTTAPRRSVRTDLENLSAGLGQGITTQLEGIKGLITDPVGTAKGAYEAARAVVRDPSVLAAALSQMGQKAMSGPLGAGEVIGEMVGPRKTGPVMAELDVYHGTPHRFPATEANPLGEFDISKARTGQGAANYGHGTYFSEDVDFANEYRPRDFEAEAKLQNLYEKAKENQNYDAMEVLKAAILHKTAGELREKYPKQADVVSEIEKINQAAAGSLFKADLPDEMIGRMLDWNKPLSEQPASVRAGVQSVLNKARQEAFDPNAIPDLSVTQIAKMNGAELHALMQRVYGSDASKEMRTVGIPGIRYQDTYNKTRNFVVFPGEEKKVRILERK